MIAKELKDILNSVEDNTEIVMVIGSTDNISTDYYDVDDIIFFQSKTKDSQPRLCIIPK